MLKKVLIGLVVVVVGFVALVASRPDTYRVARSATIAAPADVVFAQIENFHAWAAWSPWEKLDPQMAKTFSGPEKGTGASYTWQGNSDVGKGNMTITESEPPSRVRIALNFIEPFPSKADTTITVAPKDGSEVEVTWQMEGPNSFMGKMFGIFVDMDEMIGKDFVKGLTQLETVAEAEAAKKAATEAEAAKAQAAADAAAKLQAEAAAAQASAEVTPPPRSERPKP